MLIGWTLGKSRRLFAHGYRGFAEGVRLCGTLSSDYDVPRREPDKGDAMGEREQSLDGRC